MLDLGIKSVELHEGSLGLWEIHFRDGWICGYQEILGVGMIHRSDELRRAQS